MTSQSACVSANLSSDQVQLFRFLSTKLSQYSWFDFEGVGMDEQLQTN